MKLAHLCWLQPALLALALSSPRAVLADDRADLNAARAAFHEASSLAQQKQWSAACARYALSLKLHPAALTLYSLGVAQREALRLVAARASFQAFLAEPVTPTTQAYTEPARAAIAELSMRVASLTLVLVPAAVAGAAVTLDGAALPAGSLAERRIVDPGAHEVVVSAPGRKEARAHVTLPEASSVIVTLTLAPLSPPDVAVIAPLGALSPSAFPAALEGQRARREPWPRALPFALLGAGTAALAGGVTLGLVGVADAHKVSSSVDPAAGDARAKGIAGDILAGTGIAAASAGLVLLLMQRSRPARAAATPPWIGAGAAGICVSF